MGGPDGILGLGSLSLAPMLSSPGEWVDIKGQLSMDKKFSGKYSVSGMFLPQGSAPPKDPLKGVEQGGQTVLEAPVSVVKVPLPPSDAAPPVTHIPAPVPVPVPAVTPPITVPPKITPLVPVPPSPKNDIAAQKLAELSHMFEGVQRQNMDLQKKVGGLEEGINKQLNKVNDLF
jgi:hypothetical protein